MHELTKVEVWDILRLIAVEYGEKLGNTKADRDAAKLRIDMWHAALNGYPKEVVYAAVANVMRTLPFRPKLADVCKEIRRLQSLGEKSDEELWVELSGVLADVRHNTEGYRYDFDGEGERCRVSNERIYAALSPEIRDYLRSISELITVAYMSDEDLHYERSRFMKRIGEIREQARLRRETPKEVLELFAGAVPQLTEGR